MGTQKYYAVINENLGIMSVGLTEDEALAEFIRDTGERPDEAMNAIREIRPSLYEAATGGTGDITRVGPDDDGVYALRNEFEAEEATAAEAAFERFNRLEETGMAIFGREWVSPTARALGVEVRTVQRWVAARDVPEWAIAKTPEVARAAVAHGDTDDLRERASTIERVAAQG